MPITETGVGMVSEPAPIAVGEAVQPSHLLQIFELIRTAIRQMNGKLSLGGTGVDGTRAGNHDAQVRDIYFPTANVEVAILHDLGRVPVGYDVMRRDIACIVYDSNNGSWTEKVVYLKSSAAPVNVKLRVY